MGNTDSKLAFRQAVVRLAREDIPASQQPAVFAALWMPTLSADDFATLLPPSDAIALRTSRPAGFALLFLATMDRFLALATDPDWVVPPPSLLGNPMASSSEPMAITAHPSTELLNCTRILTRLVPLIWDAGPDLAGQLLLRTVPRGPAAGARAADDTGTPLVSVLVQAAVQLLFRPGFTVPAVGSIAATAPPDLGAESHADLTALAWDATAATPSEPLAPVPANRRASLMQSLAAATTTSRNPANMLTHRVELLRLALVLLSQTMYAPPSTLSPTQEEQSSSGSNGAVPPPRLSTTLTTTYPATSNPALAYIVRPRPSHLPYALARALVTSLLNSLVQAAAPPASLLSAAARAASYMTAPAGGSSSAAADPGGAAAVLAAHIMSVLVTATDPRRGARGSQIAGLLHGIPPESAQTLARALIKLLAGRRALTARVTWFHEILVVMVGCMHASETFYEVIDSPEDGDALISELISILTEYQSEQEINLIRIAIHVLASLSFKDTDHMDALVELVYALLTRPNSPYLLPFYEALLGMLRRIVVYHRVSTTSASRIVQLACVFGQPSYLIRGEWNWKLPVALCEMVEYGLIVESRSFLDSAMSYHRELASFLWVQLDQLEPPVVGKGKGRRRPTSAASTAPTSPEGPAGVLSPSAPIAAANVASNQWHPHAAWFQAWRQPLRLEQLEHVVSTLTDGPKSLEDLGIELTTLPKLPPAAVEQSVWGFRGEPAVAAVPAAREARQLRPVDGDDEDDDEESTGTEPGLPPRPPAGLLAGLHVFAWTAVYVRHRPAGSSGGGGGGAGSGWAAWQGTRPRLFKVRVVGGEQQQQQQQPASAGGGVVNV
ncbi:high-temperature-induced dauer-formation protein-domain-containing protein [Blastocladiella britannica]|nr:high-temperature-induced dauer-formation protein-domain-containing protein [Blastocladiella britannica]